MGYAAEGKVVCGVEESCAGMGCSYRNHYQWMGEECQDGDAGLPLDCTPTPVPIGCSLEIVLGDFELDVGTRLEFQDEAHDGDRAKIRPCACVGLTIGQLTLWAFAAAVLARCSCARVMKAAHAARCRRDFWRP